MPHRIFKSRLQYKSLFVMSKPVSVLTWFWKLCICWVKLFRNRNCLFSFILLKPKPVFETIQTTYRGSFIGFVCPYIGAVRKNMAASEWHMLLKLTINVHNDRESKTQLVQKWIIINETDPLYINKMWKIILLFLLCYWAGSSGYLRWPILGYR